MAGQVKLRRLEALPTLDLLLSIKRTKLSWELWLTVKEWLIILNAWRASSFSKLSFSILILYSSHSAVALRLAHLCKAKWEHSQVVG